MRRPVTALFAITALSLGPSVMAGAAEGQGPPDHVLERVYQSAAAAREKAAMFATLAVGRDGETGIPDHAQGEPGHATGLLRAQEAIEAAAARSGGRGNAFGRGHAAEVHAQLLGGGSPAELSSHADQVHALVVAFNGLKADRPGLGLGRDKVGGYGG